MCVIYYPGVFLLIELFIFTRRSLAAQQRARQKEVVAQTKSMQNTMAAGKKALQVRNTTIIACLCKHKTYLYIVHIIIFLWIYAIIILH